MNTKELDLKELEVHLTYDWQGHLIRSET